MSVAAVLGTEPLFVPEEVRDLASFRAWVHSADLPEKARIHYLNGQVWVEPEMEEIRTHSRVKTALGFALAALVDNSGAGFYFGDGVRYTNEDGDFSTEPDGIIVLADTWADGRVWTDAGPHADATELVGTPDLVIEIVSRHSVEKDTAWHLTNFHAAGVPEYWLIDARGDDVAFSVWKRGARKYAAVKPAGEWTPSPVLGRSFRLTRADRAGLPTFTLEVR